MVVISQFSIDERPKSRENRRFASSGGVPERSKGADCKSVGSAFGGSNPPPSTRWSPADCPVTERSVPAQLIKRILPECRNTQSGCGSMVEPQPSKLMMWVRFPSPAPTGNHAHIAHSVEHLHGKEGVTGSNPVVGSIDLEATGETRCLYNH